MSRFGSIVGSVRVRLLLIALLPMLVLLPLLLGATMFRWSGKVDDLLIVKVNGDLTIADQYLGRLIADSGERIDALAQSVAFREALATPETLGVFIDAHRAALGFDFLYVTDGADAPGGFSPEGWPVIAAALSGERMSAMDLFGPGQLAALDPALAARARTPLVRTEAAAPTDRVVEDRGMAIHSAAPFRALDGGRRALVGGLLLNRNLGFIDTINDLVYRARSLPEGSQGTATLFLDDVRVSTNVRLFRNVRALGTRVSAEVRRRVLGEGATWLDRAFVVNDWYISAYEPLVDSHGERIGMLYVGFLETPFREAKRVSIAVMATAFLLIAALSVPIFLRWAGRIFRPLEKMTQTISLVERGDLQARNGPAEGEDEITRVAAHLDSLLDQVQERDRQLRDWAEQLNQKVEERTRDLREANRRLESTTEKLIMSEKLAAVGEITASVAHEINNPIAVIQGNLDVAREELGAAGDVAKAEFRLIDEQVYRIGVIVSKLLQFARPGEYSGAADAFDAAEVARDCLVLTRHQLETARIEVETDFAAIAQVRMERTELQQLVVNLIVNAIHAMPEGGALRIVTADERREGREGVALSVADDGVGMDAATLHRIFDPFFTTKRAQGTGLGLSISQTLAARAGGRISAESAPGRGSRFIVWLPTVEAPNGAPGSAEGLEGTS